MTTLTRIKKPIRALLLEDSPVDAEAIAGYLTGAGYQVDPLRVETEAAFIAALAEPFDVILSDYSLPGYSCAEALEAVKQHGLEIPFIVVSGHVGEELAVAMVEGRRGGLRFQGPAGGPGPDRQIGAGAKTSCGFSTAGR